MKRALLSFATLAVVGIAPRAAFADESKQHFDRGLQFMAEKNFDAACDEFGKSDGIAPTMSTKFQLGRCNESRQRWATARYYFLECARLSTEAGDTKRAEAARQRVAEAEKNTPHLLLTVIAPVPGEAIVANGVPIPQDKWKEPLYVDPGRVRVEAGAPGRAPFRFEISTSQPGAEITVEVPALVPDRGGGYMYGQRDRRARGTPERVDPGVPMKRRSPGMFAGGIALSSIGGVGIITGLVVVGVASSPKRSCDLSISITNTGCTVEEQTGLRNAGIAITVLGVASLAAGIPLAVIGGRKVPANPEPAQARLTFEPWIGPTLAGAGLSASF
jgi:hypothetical protein